jgi:hypothetical protein
MTAFADGKIEAYLGPRELEAPDDLEAVIVDFIAGARESLGSANFTETDTHRNLNNDFVFRSASVCRQYRVEVEQLRQGQFGRGMHGEVPKTYSLGGVPVKVLFAPDHTPELEFIKQMLKVRTGGNIWFAIFTFAGSSAIDDTMLALARGGVRLRGVLDPGQARQGLGGASLAARRQHRASGTEARGRPRDPPQGAPQADGDRQPHRRRRQLQLHPAGERLQRREPVRDRLSARGGRRDRGRGRSGQGHRDVRAR